MKHYAHNATGFYLGQHNVAPADGVETPAPAHGSQRWDGAAWTGAIPAPEKFRPDLLEAALIRKGVVTAADVDAERAR